MGNFLHLLELLAVSVWLGAIVFCFFFTVPTLFRALNQAEAGKAIRVLIPRYYLLGAACGFTLTAVHLLRGFLWYWGGMIRPSILLFTLLTLLALYGRKSQQRNGRIDAFLMICLLFHITWMSMRGY